MKTAIVGYTGFVGSNICRSRPFDAYYNSRNISSAFGTEPDLLVYSGVRAEMYLANNFPDKDLALIRDAIENIRKIKPGRVVLISSIAVYDRMYGVDENTVIDKDKSTAYGRNRRILEEWVESNFPGSLIVRLPGIYGINLKKNFIFDMVRLIPTVLTEAKYKELGSKSATLLSAYTMQDNGFAKCNVIGKQQEVSLKEELRRIGFTALNFTDSRGIYQYYNLSHLWALVEKALLQGIHVLNVAVEPVTAGEIYEYVNGKPFVNELDRPIAHFDFRTVHADSLGGRDGYLMDKECCLNEVKQFIISESW